MIELSFASVCTGIAGFDIALERAGMRNLWMCEIDRQCRHVLRYHWPDRLIYEDMQHIPSNAARPDVLCGGTPCQSFSVAGLRKGLADPRGNLALAFIGLIDRLQPQWFVWENVPGLLSSDDGRAFGSFLGGLAAIGYGFAYRVLDAQYFGLAQRRKRVFVVGHIGGQWQRAAAVLFDAASLRWDSAPGKETRERLTPSLEARTRGGGGLGTDSECDEAVISVCATLTKNYSTHHGRSAGNNGGVAENQLIAHSLTSNGFDASEDGTGRGTPIVPEITGAMSSKWAKGSGAPAGDEAQNLVAMPLRAGRQYSDMGDGQSNVVAQVQWASGGGQVENPTAQALRSGAEHSYQFARIGMAVRRLTPTECERLQGFPDGWTANATDANGKTYEQKDGPRYRQLGNAVAVPVVEWIARRIMQVASIPSPDAQSSRQSPAGLPLT